ncbi:MAG: uncharacterized coiled-coil DUF342 family protein [Candidatus Midichloriaceae bacterium]|jgi:uncharacterized coiled-coil DUF342 family protein
MEIVINIVVLIFLCLTIAYCWKLNGKIHELQNNKGELAGFIKKLDSSLTNANNGIAELKNMTRESIEKISVDIKKADEISDELVFLIERGKNLVSEIENAISKSSVVTKKKKPVKKSTSTKSLTTKKKKIQKSIKEST